MFASSSYVSIVILVELVADADDIILVLHHINDKLVDVVEQGAGVPGLARIPDNRVLHGCLHPEEGDFKDW